jgi:hypothetical protein
MNATKLTLPVLIVVGFAAGILVGYLIKVRGPKCVDQPPQAAIVVGYDSYVPPSLQAFYRVVAVGPGTNAVFRRDMILVDPNGCSVPSELANVGGAWCPGDPCRIQPNMGQQVTQRVGFKNLVALKQALDSISSSPTAP